jgi:TIR domain
MHGQAAGFWSYVQQDDIDDFGRILGLAERLRAAYRLRQAEELTLFVDRESLRWGDEWNARINAAIAGTTFFIPVLTPSYFKSSACRRELLKFSREAKRLGLEQLILPVYWIDVPEMDADPDEAADEAIAVVARYQWQDFRETRLEDESSSVFRTAVDRLAADLARRASQVTATVEDVPMAAVPRPTKPILTEHRGADANGEPNVAVASGEDEDDSPGILEKLATTEDAWPQITAITAAVGTQIERVGEVTAAASERIAAAESRGSDGAKARLVQTERMAHELKAPAEELERLGYEYAVVLADLDPGVQTLLDLAAEGDVNEEGRADLLTAIQELAATADESLTELSGMLASAAEMSKLSRSLRSPLKRIQKGLQGVLDGRAVIEDWGKRARGIEQANASDPKNDSDGAESTPES